MAITLALVGLALALVPLVGPDFLLVLILGIAFGVLGVVFAAAALAKYRKTGVGNNSVAIVAIILSVAAVGLCVTWFARAEMTSGATGLHIPAVSGDRHTVEFSVTSTGGATVRYGNINDQRIASSMPSTDAWTSKASYNNGTYHLTLSADNTSASLSNTITCSLTIDGNKVSANTGTTIALCTANVG